jgi:prophage tail gpP-like protein
MPSIEIVTVEVNGQRFASWKEVSVSAGIKDAARAFRLEAAAEAGAAATFRIFQAGAAVKIRFNDDLVLDGYVDRYQPRLADKDASVTITGRSRSGDMVDSAAEHAPGKGRFVKRSIKEIAEGLDHFGVGIVVGEGVDLTPIPSYQITQGETAYRAIERLARSQGLALMGRPDGKIEITRGGQRRHAGRIAEGWNLKVGEADHNWSNRHSKYIVKGQRPFGSNAENLEIEAMVKDQAVSRYRPTVIVVEEDTDRERAKTRAEQRRNRAAGEALRASVTLQGFRDDSGLVWEPNRLIFTESDFLQVTQDMLIESVAFQQLNGSGSTTRLGLVDPKAHEGKSGGGKAKARGVNRSGAGWSVDNDAALISSEDSDGGVGRPDA